MPAPLTLRVPAKVNLYLRVVRRREDGFHEVETVLQSIGLYDELTFAPAEGLALECDWPGLPLDESNLVWKAATALRERFGLCESQGARVTIRKQIPVGAGLGGGSADAAAALVGLSRLWGLESHPEWGRLSSLPSQAGSSAPPVGQAVGLPSQAGKPAPLTELAAALGSDVPFFLEGGAAVGRGRGEILEPVPAPAEPLWLVLVKPPFPVSTPVAYRSWRAEACGGPDLQAFLAAFATGDPAAVAGALRNDLEPGVAAVHPELPALLARLTELGCLGARMTGSGSAVFGIAGDEDEARRIADLLDPACGARSVHSTLPRESLAHGAS